VRNGSFFCHGDDTWAAVATLRGLSRREIQIIECVINHGSDEGEISEAIGISRHTVHTHLERLYRKLGVRSRSQLLTKLFLDYLEQLRSRGVVASLPCDDESHVRGAAANPSCVRPTS
jgi:DNA-binding CsgD family transcriptional regulator